MFSGKSTLADKFVNTYNYQKIAFADPVKKFAVNIFKMDPCNKDRDLLQKIGDGAREIIDQNVWINLLINKINSEENKGKLFVCDDIRYENEAEALRRNNWKIVKVFVDDDEEKMNDKKYPNTWKEHWIEKIIIQKIM